MGRSFRFDHRLLIAVLGLELAACGLGSDLSAPSAPALPANGGATLSGTSGAANDAGVTEFGDDSVIASVDGGYSEGSAAGTPGGIDSGGASSRSAGGIGGVTSTRGGAAGAGGMGAPNGRGGAAAAAGSSAMPSPPPTIFFSEYVEGSSSNKALEIVAEQRSVLDGCKVGAYFNGQGAASVVATLNGTLEAGHVLTLCTSTLKAKLGSVCDQIGRLTFNGNDAVAISCDGKILDVLGQIGVDPGAAWGTGSSSTLNHTLRRKCSVTRGDPSGLDTFDPTLEWAGFP